MFKSLLSKAFLVFSVSVIAACSNSAIAPETENPEFPEEWARQGDAGSVDLNWLDDFADEKLDALVAEAVANNFQLAQERARVYQAEQSVIVTRANKLPSLDVSLDGSRRQFEDASATAIASDSYNATLRGRWDVDVWGRFSAAQKAAELRLAASVARMRLVERNVATATASAYFNAMQAKQLLDVARRRLDNATSSQEIVASGYRQGLNDALDLYLARNQVEREEANYALAEQNQSEAIASLQRSLARYPDGEMEIPDALPVIEAPIPTGMPSELLTRRTDLQESWLNLLAADSDLASAHKARFPSLTLSASYGLATRELNDLLRGEGTAWTLAGGLTQPLFQAGRLKALEQQAFARVQLAEQQYLDLLYSAFADVENSISRSASLQKRFESFVEAEKNSRAALQLATEQYQRGLVPYTTVLESQRQAYDAVTQVVQLKNQRLQNRIALYLSLGGEFSTTY
jgi:NodT family efflux transporter outer membrane factor (OMF) lipoprotein